jgi:SM-20-related protein
MIKVRILLRGGHVYETACRENAPLLEKLSDALLSAGSPNAWGVEQLTIETEGRLRGLAIPRSAIVAVETEPATALGLFPKNVTVERAHYIRIPSFLTEDENRTVLNYALGKQSSFEASTVDTGVSGYRQSQVIFRLDDLGVTFEQRIREILPEVLKYFGLPLPSKATFETQLSSHNDGGYFKIHNDNGSPRTANRLLTYIYYFHRQPSAFTGGKLRLYDSKIEARAWVAAETFIELEPENNALLMFPSRLMHEVLPISCRSRAFADGRFTLNGWVRNEEELKS